MSIYSFFSLTHKTAFLYSPINRSFNQISKGCPILIKTKTIEDNFFAVCRYWGNLNSSLKQSASISAMSTGVRVSDINWVFNEAPLNFDDAKHILEIKEYYRKLNRRFWWWVYPRGQSSETGGSLQNAGLRFFTKVPCLAADLNNSFLNYNLTDKIKVIPVKTKEDLLLWKDTSFDGFEMPSYAREQYTNFVSKFIPDEQAPQRLFLAYFNDRPVATSLLFTYRDTAGIYYVSTLPNYRNKGCGLKVTQAAMQSAKESGFKDVILQATPLGERIYIRAGFKEYCKADIYKI